MMTNAELIRHCHLAPSEEITSEQAEQYRMLVNLTGELGVCQKDYTPMDLVIEGRPEYPLPTWVCPTCGWRVGK
jgi:hypothetical protein